MPNGVNGLTPSEIFTGTKMDNINLRIEKTWGCPTCDLGSKLQGGKKLPKWIPRTRKKRYLGKSPNPASSMRIRNLTTGFISPQFHVIHDIKLETVSGWYEENEAAASHIWDYLAENQRFNALEEENSKQQPLLNLHRDWLSPEEIAERERHVVNAEAMRRLHRRDTNIDPTMEVIPETTPAVEEVSETIAASGSES